LALGAQSQSIRIVDTDASQSGVVGSEVRTTVKLQNISSQPILITVHRIEQQIGSSQKTFYCIDNDCLDENIAVSHLSKEILPGETIDYFNIVLQTGLVQGISTVKYRFSTAYNPDDFVEFEINYSIEERIKEGILYSSEKIELNDVYPNPVSDIAIFDYLIKENNKEAKIVIHNVLGSIAGEYILSPYESKLKVEMELYNPGVYFYTLYLDNEGVATKKLVVRK
jgi:hypothetical protein